MFINHKLSWYRLLLKFTDLINGIWSGFPLCCICYFVRIHNGVNQPAHDTAIKFKAYKHIQCGYVRCPSCIKEGCYIKKECIRDGAIPIGKFCKIIENYST